MINITIIEIAIIIIVLLFFTSDKIIKYITNRYWDYTIDYFLSNSSKLSAVSLSKVNELLNDENIRNAISSIQQNIASFE